MKRIASLGVILAVIFSACTTLKEGRDQLETKVSLNSYSDYNYLIIYDEQDSRVAEEVFSFAQWKQDQRGFRVKAVSVSEAVKVGTGEDRIEKIRRFARGVLSEQGPNFILLIGHPGSSRLSTMTNGNIPMRIVYSYGNRLRKDIAAYEGSYPFPTDYCYEDLDGYWDLNGNGLYGEMQNGGDNVLIDMVNAYAGRIPFSDYRTVKRVLQYIIDTDEKFNKKAVRSILFADAFGATLENVKKSIPANDTVVTLYEREGVTAPAQASTAPLNAENFVSYFGGKDFIYSAGHGGIARSVWIDKNGNKRLDAGDEEQFPYFLAAKNASLVGSSGIWVNIGCSTFDPTFPFVVSSGAIDTRPNEKNFSAFFLAEGKIATAVSTTTIGNVVTTVGIISHFLNGKTLGESLFYTILSFGKTTYSPELKIQGTVVLLEDVILGDPSLKLGYVN